VLVQFFLSSRCFEHPKVHHQEDYIVHVALYVMFSMHVCKPSTRLKDVL